MRVSIVVLALLCWLLWAGEVSTRATGEATSSAMPQKKRDAAHLRRAPAEPQRFVRSYDEQRSNASSDASDVAQASEGEAHRCSRSYVSQG